MNPPKISFSEMESKHVIRADECRGSDLAFLDQRIPNHEREIVNVIGMNVVENIDDPLLKPKIGNAHGFSLVYNRAKEGSQSGAALHAHQTEEVFIPLVGSWEVIWLEGDDEHSIRLEPLDVINVPVGIYRGFRLVSGGPDSIMLAIVGGPDAGNVSWHPNVIERARETGLEVDEKGDLVELKL